MCDEHLRAFQLEQDVLAAPRHALDATPAQTPREDRWRRVRRETGAQQSRGRHAARSEEAVEGARDEFDFGQLRHKKRDQRLEISEKQAKAVVNSSGSI
jgi:hypothetical protein